MIVPGTVTPMWISNIVLFAAPLGILAAGQTLVMLSGGIDLSVASVATASAYLMATHSSLGSVACVLWGLSVGLAVGLINGVGVAVLQVQPLVMTLGTGLMTQGTLIVYSQKMLANAPRVPSFIQSLGSGKVLGGIPIDLILWAPIALVVLIGLRRTGLGRLLYAVGDNREACQLSGVRVWQVLLTDYVLCGSLAAVAGLVIVGDQRADRLGRCLPVAVGGGHHRRDFDLRRSRRLCRQHRGCPHSHGAQQLADASRCARTDQADSLRRDHPDPCRRLYSIDGLMMQTFGVGGSGFSARRRSWARCRSAARDPMRVLCSGSPSSRRQCSFPARWRRS